MTFLFRDRHYGQVMACTAQDRAQPSRLPITHAWLLTSRPTPITVAAGVGHFLHGVTRRRQQVSPGTRVCFAIARMLDGRTQWHALSAAVNNPMVSGSLREVQAASQRLTITTTSASPPTVRWSSADDAAIEPTCPGLTDSAQTGLLAHGWAGHGRWCHDRAPSGARCAKAAIAFQPFVIVNEPMTHATRRVPYV